MSKMMMIIASLALGFVAQAEEGEKAKSIVKSEYFYQTEANKNEATPELGYTSSTSKPVDKNLKEATTKNTLLSVTYERGLNDVWAFGGTLGYVTGKFDNGTTETDNKGLDDVQLFVKGMNSLTPGTAYNFGATLNYSLGKKEVKATEESVNSGGVLLTPYLGYQYLIGNAVIGTKLQTTFHVMPSKIDYRTTTPATEEELTGGNRSILTGFYETTAAGATWGGEVGYWGTSTTESKVASTTNKFPGETGYTVGGYTRWDVTPQATFVGKLSWENQLSNHNEAIDSTNVIDLNLGGRFTF